VGEGWDGGKISFSRPPAPFPIKGEGRMGKIVGVSWGHYINNNPVKRRLVESAEKYLWSSANSNFENDLKKIISGSGTSPIT
jgi:hypothetical protein